jgi:F0F1-type ATP synthase membrane subunit c/vacuolar-type H+-ATPase subunit K
MTKFKDRLWRDLVREYGEDLGEIRRPAGKHSRRGRPRVLAGAAVGLAGAGAAVAIVLGAASTAPAFAVTPNHDGTIQVKIFRSAGIPGANARLSAMGIRARVVAVAAGCQAHGVRGVAVSPRAPLQARQARIDPGRIAIGRTLVLATWRKGQQIQVAPARLISGPAPMCLPPISVSCGPPPAGNGPGSGTSGTGTTASSGNNGTGTTAGSGTGGTGTTVSSGTSGNSGSPLPLPIAPQVLAGCQVPAAAPPPSENHGNSGNSAATCVAAPAHVRLRRPSGSHLPAARHGR